MNFEPQTIVCRCAGVTFYDIFVKAKAGHTLKRALESTGSAEACSTCTEDFKAAYGKAREQAEAEISMQPALPFPF